jgi:hypothetical protein
VFGEVVGNNSSVNPSIRKTSCDVRAIAVGKEIRETAMGELMNQEGGKLVWNK